MTGQCIRVFEGHQASVTAAALSPSGAILFSAAEEETLRLWDTFSGRCEAVLKTPNNVTTAAALSEDMRLALSAGLYDHTITVWDMESRKPIKALKGHTGRIVSVSFTPDGRFALSAAHDATVRLWDLENAQTPGVLKGHTAAVTSASLGGNALLAVSSSRDGTLRLWHLDWRLDAAGDFTEWDEGAAHCLRTFLDLRIPYLEDAMTRRGTPQWGEGDFKELLTELGRRGFGRIKPDGVLRKLRQMEAALEEARLKEEAAFNESVRAAEALIKAKDYAGAYAEVEKARLIAGYAREPRAMELSDKLLGVFARGGISAAWKLRTFKGHAGGIACAAAIQNCRYVLTGGEDGALNLWETASWKILRAFKGHAGAVTCAVVGPLERYAVTGGADASVRLWDLLTGKGLAVYKNHTQAVTSAAMTRNRRFILSGAADAGVCLTDITAGEPVYLFRGRAAGVTGLCFTPDDGTWLCAYADGVIHARDTATGALLFELSGHKQPVTCVRVTGDGRFALSASRDRTLRVWDIGRELSMDAGVDGGGEYPRKIKPQRVLDFRFGGVRSFAPGPDGRFFIAGDEYGRLLVVEAGGAAALDFRAHKGRINAVDVGRDGRIALSAGDDGSVCLWRLDWRPDIRPAADWDDGALPYIDRFAAQNQQAYSAQGGPDAAAFSENDLQGLMDDLSKGGCGWLRPDAVRKKAVERILLRAGRLKEERERFERAIKAAEEAVNSGDLKTALAAAVTASRVKGFERSEETLAAMGRLNLLLPKKAPAGSWKTGSLKGHTEGVSALAAGAGGLIAGGGEDGTVRLWDLKTGRCAHTITAHTEGVSALAFSADGRNVFSAGRDQVIRVWDTASGRAVDALEGHTGGVLALAASPDGRYLVSGGGDQTVRLWDTASLSASPQLTQGVASPTHGIASPAEKGRKCLKVLEGHIGSVTSASFTEDGWYVLTSGRDGAVCVWDVENAGMSGGRRILVMKGHHSGSVACAAVSPDMRYLASAGEDRTVRVYDALRGECIHVLKGHAGAVTAVTFSPDSRHLLSASEDRTMRLWECLSGRHEHTVEGHTAKIRAAIFAADGSTIISCGDEKNVLSWHIQWELEERAAGGWSDSVRPYLDTCVIRLMPNAKSVLTLQSKPRVENSDVERLAAELALRGFGWLGREALVLHLGETAAKWKEVLQRRRAWCSKLAGKT
jgi:WD40 repeat protein